MPDTADQVMGVLRQMGLTGAANWIGQRQAEIPDQPTLGGGGFSTSNETPEQRRQRSIDIGMSLGPGILAGEGARGVNLGALEEAKAYLKNKIGTTYFGGKDMGVPGMSPGQVAMIPHQDLWSRFGWAPGAEGKWRTELPGQAADPVLLNKLADLVRTGKETTVPIGSVASKEFLKAYPTIGDQPLHLGQSLYSGGRYSPSERTATMLLGMSTGPFKTPVSTFEHEVGAHAVQHKEGMARGGGVDPFESPELAGLGIPSSVLLRLIRSTKNYLPDDFISAWMKDNPAGLVNYLRLAGETEARNMQYRQANPSVKKYAPIRTEDVPRDWQIVRMHSPEELR